MAGGTTERHFIDKFDPDIITRASWINAAFAYRQIKRGYADGNRCALWIRSQIQHHFFCLGCGLQLHCGKVIFLGLLLFSLCCVGLKTAYIESDIEKLWVEDGGRLEQELLYTRQTLGEGSGTTYEVVVQAPAAGEKHNLLNNQAVLHHLNTVLEATHIDVQLDGITWTFQDICYAANFPEIEDSFIDHILYGLLPCVIMTPLDCFWEGSLLLGPDYPVLTGGISGIPDALTWSNLNPADIASALSRNINTAHLGIQLMETMNMSGVGTAYQQKPCLNPYDDRCPELAPNKISRRLPDLGAEFTGGCSGFSSSFMRWPEDLLFGGIMKNKTNHISRVEAYQTVLQLMGEEALFSYWDQTIKTSGTEWNVDVARQVLETWQRKFVSVVNLENNSSAPYNTLAFSYTSLSDVMQSFSNISSKRIFIGYVLMVIYACISLMEWRDTAVASQSGVGMLGVLLVSLAVAAGLGICSVLGLAFNASTTQIIPFLTLGLGVDDMFMIAHTYSNMGKHIPFTELTGQVLQRTGITVALTSVTNVLAFSTAYFLIPIPALRVFSLQAAVLVVFNFIAVLLVFPALVSVDLHRRRHYRMDVFCCLYSRGLMDHSLSTPPSRHTMISSMRHQPSPPPSYTAIPIGGGAFSQLPAYRTVTHLSPGGSCPTTSVHPEEEVFLQCSHEPCEGLCHAPSERVSFQRHCSQARDECLTWSFTCLACKLYSFLLEHTFVKVTVLCSLLLPVGIGGWGISHMQDGLDFTDIVPQHSPEFQFLKVQRDYFGFYSIYLVTKDGIDYPHQQLLLHHFNIAFRRVEEIVRPHDGSASPFWLSTFRQWLEHLQADFDSDVLHGRITEKGWLNNASDNAILAYKLLSQTGDANHPVDDTKVFVRRLVSSSGIINPSAFYTYLTAWYTNDAMGYSASMANIHPIPKEWHHDRLDDNFVVLKSQPIVYAQIPFFLVNLSTTADVIKTVKEIRAICDEFNIRGLPNYPSGYPFTYWEQYINLRFYLLLALVTVLSTTFLVLSIVLVNAWLALIVVSVLSVMLVELFGFMGLMGIKLSAIPAVILIMTVGIGVEFTLHVAVGFLTAIGSHDRRVMIAMEHTFAPVMHGIISTFLGIVMLVTAEFDFIVKYFFNVLAALVVVGLLNGLLLLPILLSVLGPRGEVVLHDDADFLSNPTPEPSPSVGWRRYHQPSSCQSGVRWMYPRQDSDISLSTITEEPTQYSSHEIIVHPEVVVKTTSVLSGDADNVSDSACGAGLRSGERDTMQEGSCNETSFSSKSSDKPTAHFKISGGSGHSMTVTKVKATTTVIVEVHSPVYAERGDRHKPERSYKSKRRKSEQPSEWSSHHTR